MAVLGGYCKVHDATSSKKASLMAKDLHLGVATILGWGDTGIYIYGS